MKLLTPVNSFDSTVKQIQAGANEIYLGGDTEVFRNLSFSGRGRFTAKNERICPDFNELKEIVEYSHNNNVKVMFTANIPFLADGPLESNKYIRLFYDYVLEGLKAGVDSVVVGDIGAIQFLRQEGIDIHLTTSTFLETVNREQVEFLKELGANRVVLSYQLVLDEIKAISTLEDIELEVFGHYGCSFYDDCNLKHNYGETVKHCIGTPCRNSYKIIRNGEIDNKKSQYLNSSLACSICSLHTLYEIGIYALKLVGRDLDMEQNVQITSIYSQMLEGIKNNKMDLQTFLNHRLEILPDWWKRVLCENKQCKYLENPITKSFVGLK